MRSAMYKMKEKSNMELIKIIKRRRRKIRTCVEKKLKEYLQQTQRSRHNPKDNLIQDTEKKKKSKHSSD